MKWERKTLGDITNIFSGYAFKSLSMSKNEGIPLIKIKNILSNSVTEECDTYLIPDKIDPNMDKFILQQGDFLVAMTGQGSVGRIGRMKKVIRKFYVNQRVAIVRTNLDIANPSFVYYQIATKQNEKVLFDKANGAGQPNISAKQIGELPVALPTIDIQDKIASILSAYDDLIENNQKQIKLLEEAAQRLYKEWFVDLHFPGYENVKVVDGVPEGWRKVQLSEIADIVMGQSPKSEFYNTDKQGLPFHQGVSSYGTRFVVDDTYSTAFTKIAEAGSILFSVRAPVGRLNLTKNKIVIGRGLSAINHKTGLQSFMFYMLKEKFYKDNIVGNGSIFASISKNELLSQEFIIPNDELSKRYNAIVLDIDKKIESLDSQLQLLTEARDRLLPKLMRGELEV